MPSCEPTYEIVSRTSKKILSLRSASVASRPTSSARQAMLNTILPNQATASWSVVQRTRLMLA